MEPVAVRPDGYDLGNCTISKSQRPAVNLIAQVLKHFAATLNRLGYR